jgi:RHS repeat-associated protein
MTLRTFHAIALFGLFATSCAGMAGDGDGDQIGEAVSLAFAPANTVGRAVASGNGLMHVFKSYDLRGRDIAAQHVLDGKSSVYSTAYGFPCASDACTGYQFNSKDKEPDGSGLYDYGARLYNPATGRFLSADTDERGLATWPRHCNLIGQRHERAAPPAATSALIG